MAFPRLSKFDVGQQVRVLDDLFNDGSFPDAPPEALLAPAGAVGEIVKAGMVVGTDTPIYLVEFEESRVVGCLEEEITPLSERSVAGVMRD
ncbi:nitrogen fixation protein NifZ [Rhodoblastus sp.]|uniref:nitrogen fixation protein NifZ n=1 Tax=Rhodoblastus sp. TaxID=1962975 RepID=UPI00263946A5|nr:nitrogen fixation protein NifZ [Rhodoblastus sp.]